MFKKFLAVLLVMAFLAMSMPVMAKDVELLKTEQAAIAPIEKIDARCKDIQAQAKTLTDKKAQLQNTLMQIDQQLLMLQGAFNELQNQKAELSRLAEKK